jgi:hypothetical protein
MGKYQKNIENARSVTIMQYLTTCHPGELVRKTDDEYCTKTHGSLVITPSKDFTGSRRISEEEVRWIT